MVATTTPAAVSSEIFARDVREGLSAPGQKKIPPRYFYDDVGSALFEAITYLPEYGLTRAEERILKRHAADFPHKIRPTVIAELGSGSGRKTRRILEEFVRNGPITYYPIDVSASALSVCRQEMAGIDRLTIVELETTFLEGLRHVVARRQGADPVLVLFLGSSIGNFEAAESDRFLSAIRELLATGDGFLLGADLEQDLSEMLEAYDDPAGVTAAFNRNLLARINRELGGTFDIARFQHLALYNHADKRVEMHLRSEQAQTVFIEAAGASVSLEEGETIWTESSHKYSRADLDGMAERAGFQPVSEWLDQEWPFAVSLWLAGSREAG